MGLASPRNTTHLVKRAQGDDEEPMPGRAHATEDIPAAPEVARPPATARRHTGHGADETPGDRPGRAAVTLSAETGKRELTTSGSDRAGLRGGQPGRRPGATEEGAQHLVCCR